MIAKNISKKNKKETTVSELKDIVQGVDHYNALINSFKNNIGILKELNKKIDQQELVEQCNTELTVATGVDPNGERVSSEDRLNRVRKQIQEGKNQLKLALIGCANINSDCQSMREYFQGPEKTIFQKFYSEVQKSGKYWKDKDSRNQGKKLIEKRFRERDSPVQRYVPKIEVLIRSALKSQDNDQFEIKTIGKRGSTFESPGKSLMRARLRKKYNFSQQIFVVYFSGGVSQLEISFIKSLENDFPSVTFLVGGSHVLSIKKYIQS